MVWPPRAAGEAAALRAEAEAADGGGGEEAQSAMD